MSPQEIVAILAMTGWAIYKQTVVAEVTQSAARFKTAVIYAAVGLAVGGFDTPSGWAGWAMIATGLVLSFLVGVARGHLTKLWVGADGRLWRRGTPLTVGLFIALIVVKFALGYVAYVQNVDDGAGFGEVLAMIAIMIAVQAQLVSSRARQIAPPVGGTGAPPVTDSPARETSTH